MFLFPSEKPASRFDFFTACGIISSVQDNRTGVRPMLLEELKQDLEKIKTRLETLRRHL
jgi:hypothetical protein